MGKSLLGALGAIAAISIRLIEKNRSDKRKRTNNVAPKKQIDRKVIIYRIIYFFSIIIAICGTGSLIKLTIFPSKPEIAIANLKDSDSVEQTTILEGTYKNISKNEKIWVFINSLEVNRYYPQNTFAELDANGNWSSLAYFGQERDTGKKFKIIIVLVNEDAIIQILNYLKDAVNKNDYSGMEKIPENAVIYVQKIVIRK